MNASSGLLRKSPQNTVNEYRQEGKLCCGRKEPFKDIGNLGGPFGYTREHSRFCGSSPFLVEKARASICLVTIDDGVWASGVLLNHQGLILTNAHLLEPWRYGKTHLNGGGYVDNPNKNPFLVVGATSFRTGVEGNQKSQTLQSKMAIRNPFTANEKGGYMLKSTYKSHKVIRVRLDHVKPWVWCDAKVVYVCKGPWDVALLQLESVDSVQDQLSPITINFSPPSLGSKAYVIGHGQFGPRCGMCLGN